ncbi:MULTISPECIES: copper resistance protein CopC [unclassified Streptomyces]|uniref:copper resistance CopC/CopD family protein n=1 Tax=unclassified Streptomyces TaxID=2593676 RepID=UPI00190CAA9B|nr:MULTISPECIES: copper resistance protein CopC [unclassified Streptomyces]MBK3569663.1 copper resistance protein CopC/CopD [Streptomyces sp. MBT62]MBK6016264.1 copper resistance protein CopC/CopD [Streptomyces sp. MBT53]
MLLGTVLVLLLLGSAGTASAHAALESTDPADGSVLKSAPRSLTLTFSESVALLDDSFRVYDPDNRRVKTSSAHHAKDAGDTASVTLPAKLGTGTFTVAWRVVSADSHPVSGAFTFSIGKPSATTTPISTAPNEEPLTGSLYDIARYFAYIAAALLIGTATFMALCRPPNPTVLNKPILMGWWTLLASTLALLILRAPYEAGTGLAAAFDPSALPRTLTTRPGQALVARLLLLAATAVFLLRLRGRDRFGRVTLGTGAALAVALALTWASAEHASAGIQVPVAMTSAVLHLLAMSVWLGGLTALLTVLYRSTDLDAAPVTRFSRLAFISVTVLVVTGVYQSWRGLGSWNALTGTSYGRILLVKLGAVVLLLAAAAWSRQWTARLAGAEVPLQVPELVRTGADAATTNPSTGDDKTLPDPGAGDGSPDGYRRGLRRSVLLEVAVGVTVLVITTLLTNTLPGRAAAEAQQTATPADIPAASVTMVPFRVGNAGGKVQITLDPGRVGLNSVEAVVYGPDGGFATVPELRLSFTLPAQKIGPLDADIKDEGGYWGTNSLNIPIAGTWTMKVTVRTSDIDQVSVERRVRIVR